MKEVKEKTVTVSRKGERGEETKMRYGERGREKRKRETKEWERKRKGKEIDGMRE